MKSHVDKAGHMSAFLFEKLKQQVLSLVQDDVLLRHLTVN